MGERGCRGEADCERGGIGLWWGADGASGRRGEWEGTARDARCDCAYESRSAEVWVQAPYSAAYCRGIGISTLGGQWCTL